MLTKRIKLNETKTLLTMKRPFTAGNFLKLTTKKKKKKEKKMWGFC